MTGKRDNTLMVVEEIDFTDRELVERYDRLFEACPDAFIQQSTYWCSVIKDLGPDKPIFLLCSDAGEDIAGLPLYLYEHEIGNILTSVPQAGPLGGIFHKRGISWEEKDEAYKWLLHKAIEIAIRHQCISVTVITNPFSGDIDLYERHLSPNYVFENFTQYIPLKSIFSDGVMVLPDYNRRSNLSRNIKKGRGSGYSIRFCDSQDQLKAWHEIHCQRHTQLGAVPLDYHLFDNMYEHLVPRQKAQLILVVQAGEIASGCFYVYHRQVMDVYMLSVSPDYVELGANYVNTDYALRWANDLGIAIFNWQSAPNKESGVYRYKRQWGSVDSTYYFVTRLLCDPRRIQEIGINTLRQQYRWHYVLPFGAFKEGFGSKYFKKG